MHTLHIIYIYIVPVLCIHCILSILYFIDTTTYFSNLPPIPPFFFGTILPGDVSHDRPIRSWFFKICFYRIRQNPSKSFVNSNISFSALARFSKKKQNGLLHRKLTWNLKMIGWKMIFLFQGCILRFHVNLPGCMICPGKIGVQGQGSH